MPINLSGRPFLRLLDFSTEQIEYLLKLSKNFKDLKRTGTPHRYLEGKNIVLLFEKTSTRTRCAFETSCHDLGLGFTYLSNSHFGNKETVKDSIRVFSEMYDAIVLRAQREEAYVREVADIATIPVINACCEGDHPTQMLADLLTIREHFGHLKGIRMTYMGDARYNMGNSLMVACAKMGMHFTACTTAKYFPAKELVAECEAIAAQTGGSITLTEDVKAGTKDVDVIYTDVWVSMGEPDEVWTERIKELSPYQVNKAVMDNAGEQAIFMHCLPAFHDLKTKIGAQMGERFGITEMEVTDEVFESGQSLVFEEAENRMHTIKAVMAATL